jgi:iron(II)-dependent oxidoreductase
MTRAEVAPYRDVVEGRALDLLGEADLDGPDPLLRNAFLYTMIVAHEHQHQETILQSLQMLPGGYPLPPAAPVATPGPCPPSDRGDMVEMPGGVYPIGSAEHTPYDNEGPAHDVLLAPFRIDRFPVTCGQYLDFVDSGGYLRPELWTPAGRRWLADSGERAPKHWHRSGHTWVTERFGIVEPIDWLSPVVHVCWYEADAFARWAGKRLPTEFEWEAAATWDPEAGRARRNPWGEQPPAPAHANIDQRRFGCAPVGSHPLGAAASGCEQMIGDVWEWTASDFLPYPGFRAFPYREYSEVFFGADHKVLRGGSWATRSTVARASFRNWDYPIRRQIFAGFRCAAQGDAQ